MKDVKQTLLERVSTRRYEREPITDEQMNFIYEAIRNTPTSYNGQQFSVIDVTDQEMKEKMYELTNQKQIKTCNHFLLFCMDYHKMKVAADAVGSEMPPFNHTMDGIIVGIVDASLAMMSAIVAAESMGLGCCPIGYARTAAPEAFAQILKLPSKKVFVVCGLAIGVPREHNDLKPKQPLPLVIHKNTYRQDDMVEDLLAYDQEVKEYNATRSGGTSSNDWINHILGYYREALNFNMLATLQRHGFDLDK